jgi:hypothetical protein
VIGRVCTSRDIKRELIRGFVVHAGRFSAGVSGVGQIERLQPTE